MESTTAVVVTSAAVAGGLNLAVQLKDKGTGTHLARPVIGTVILTAVLLLVAQWWPAGARGLALVILLTAVVMNGGKVFDLISSLVD